MIGTFFIVVAHMQVLFFFCRSLLALATELHFCGTVKLLRSKQAMYLKTVSIICTGQVHESQCLRSYDERHGVIWKCLMTCSRSSSPSSDRREAPNACSPAGGLAASTSPCALLIIYQTRIVLSQEAELGASFCRYRISPVQLRTLFVRLLRHLVARSS
jgi:hypothetical protein